MILALFFGITLVAPQPLKASHDLVEVGTGRGDKLALEMLRQRHLHFVSLTSSALPSTNVLNALHKLRANGCVVVMHIYGSRPLNRVRLTYNKAGSVVDWPLSKYWITKSDLGTEAQAKTALIINGAMLFLSDGNRLSSESCCFNRYELAVRHAIWKVNAKSIGIRRLLKAPTLGKKSNPISPHHVWTPLQIENRILEYGDKINLALCERDYYPFRDQMGAVLVQLSQSSEQTVSDACKLLDEREAKVYRKAGQQHEEFLIARLWFLLRYAPGKGQFDEPAFNIYHSVIVEPDVLPTSTDLLFCYPWYRRGKEWILGKFGDRSEGSTGGDFEDLHKQFQRFPLRKL